MNKPLAQYLFGNETLFVLDKSGPESVSDLGIAKELVKSIVKEPTEQLSAEKPKSSMPPQDVVLTSKVVVMANGFTEPQIGFLTKVLAAVNFDIKNVKLFDVLKLQNQKVNFESSSSEKIISFGVNLRKIGLNHPLKLNQVIPIGRKQILIVEQIDKIQLNQNDEKKILWGLLKSVFDIK